MSLLRWILALARELSDEAGYRRYLARTGQSPSPEVWPFPFQP